MPALMRPAKLPTIPLRTSVLLALWLSSVPAIHGANAIPQAISADRYAAMKERCPFALATPPAPPPVQSENSFAANWFVAGIGRLNDNDYVAIKARDLSTQFSLYGHEPNPQNGVTLASVNWSETVGKSTVILRKGNETAKLEFNEAELRAAPPTGKNGAPPAHPGGGQPVVGGGVPPSQQANGPGARPLGNGLPSTAGPKIVRPGGPNTIAPPTAARPPATGAVPFQQLNIQRRVAPGRAPR